MKKKTTYNWYKPFLGFEPATEKLLFVFNDLTHTLFCYSIKVNPEVTSNIDNSRSGNSLVQLSAYISIQYIKNNNNWHLSKIIFIPHFSVSRKRQENWYINHEKVFDEIETLLGFSDHFDDQLIFNDMVDWFILLGFYISYEEISKKHLKSYE